MLRLLRWGTLVVLILILVGVVWSYPLLRERVFVPMLAAPDASLEVLSGVDATTQPTATLGTAQLPSQASTAVPTLIVQALPPADPPSMADRPVTQDTTSTITRPALVLPSEVAVLLANSTQEITDTTPTAVADQSATASIAILETASPLTPAQPRGRPPIVGAFGYQPPIAPPFAKSKPDTMPGASIVITTLLATLTPSVISTDGVSATSSAIGEVALVTAVNPIAQVDIPVPLSIGPTANITTPLYVAPALSAATIGQAIAGESLPIIGFFTEGTWYLLANGLWLPGGVVDNAPLTLPLVVPTMTPSPTAIPLLGQTPLSPGIPTGTATSTATGIETADCACSADNLDCLGNIFANRGEAQRCFDYCLRQTGLDIHLLDPNLNGIACENLP